ncbi:DUF4266 domain-containing protein [Shewanella eurypsychrophilus]|uniref:DUF4266 domain-containing protein n=1 Tax=Shewanella eurypsychrophilus TaxID=2593656 RepID=A0ABX6V6K3_9GAMM|nr:MULTISPECIES: DUF4266 domain-containing protein [Shewanella]QFU22967.1 DUF4266 domain-containing protein [Shewanella sp. YLB-09]QPG58253.1 DUF4266 domain-containing protein [Shewanella eurypsychrophilus]
MIKTVLTVCLTCFSLVGCSSLGVQPWERDQFAREDMAVDNDKMDLTINDHIYFSKEGTSGGRALAGGGCGCN